MKRRRAEGEKCVRWLEQVLTRSVSARKGGNMVSQRRGDWLGGGEVPWQHKQLLSSAVQASQALERQAAKNYS